MSNGNDIKWVDTVLGIVATPGSRTGDLATTPGGSGTGTLNATVSIAQGCIKTGDGGGGLFWWDATAKYTSDDGGTVIVPNSVYTSRGYGAWRRIWSGVLNVLWFGAASSNATLAIQNAINARAGNVTVYLPSGSYTVSNTISITNDRTNIVGDGVWATSITFTPSTNSAVLFSFGKASGVLYQCSMRGIALQSTTTNPFQKTAIMLTDTSQFLLEDLAVYPTWTSPSNGSSIGLHTCGRELAVFGRLNIYADRPIYIDTNPHASRKVVEDADHFHFSDLGLACTNSIVREGCIVINSGVNVSNFVIDGTNDLSSGHYGILWTDTSTSVASINVSISNVRIEGTSVNHGGPGQAIDIEHNYGLENLRIENVTCDVGAPGMKFRKVSGLTMDACQFSSTSNVALDLDGTCGEVEWTNCFFQAGATSSIVGLTEAGSMPKIATGAPLPPSAHYLNTTYAGYTPSKSWGAHVIKHLGTLASGSFFRIPSINNTAYELAVITVASHNHSYAISEGGIWLFTTLTCQLMGGTPNVAATDVAGKLCLVWGGNNDADLYNNLAQPVDYVISVEYR